MKKALLVTSDNLNKVAKITLLFWIMKTIATTLVSVALLGLLVFYSHKKKLV